MYNHLNGFEYFASVIIAWSVSVFKNATSAALSGADKLASLGWPFGSFN